MAQQPFTMLRMLLLAGLFLGGCGGGNGDPAKSDPQLAASPQPIVNQLIQQGYIKASNTNADDSFGLSVALFGDTLVVGAYQEGSNATGVNGNQADNSASNSGAVYIFTRTGGVWTQQAYLKASNTRTGDAFGGALPSQATRWLWELRFREVMSRASIAMGRTIVRQALGRSMCSRVLLGSGLSRPISRPRIPMLGTIRDRRDSHR